MSKNSPRPQLLHLSVEEENLAAIPFAVLERRVGKRTAKIEIQGTRILPNGEEVRVVWQVQGNNELGLPTEQDLDLFVALGVLTFRNNFAKTVSFTGREMARLMKIGSVNGRFYQRLKVAMDRFIPLRFRSLTATDQHEQVKWCNVFQEASFSLDRQTGRCTGTVTWTDKLIQSMDSGFFRVLDAGRYMDLDGITAKHLYRFLAMAFEKTDLVVIDARRLAQEHIGILNPPKYFSRLLQTLEPALDQLIRIQVLGSYYVVSPEEWRIALHRHPAYVPERKTLLLHGTALAPELSPAALAKSLEAAGFEAQTAAEWCAAAQLPAQRYHLARAISLLRAMREEGVPGPAALNLIKAALDEEGAAKSRDCLDWYEIGLEFCQNKRRGGQVLQDPAGVLAKFLKDPAMRRRAVDPEAAERAKRRFRLREQAALDEQREAEEKLLILEYEAYRQQQVRKLFEEMGDAARQVRRKEKLEALEREAQGQEVDEMILQDIARKEVPPYARWLLRKRAMQAVLPEDTGA